MRRIAITDIHGCAKTFKELLQRIGIGKEDQLFLLGDYIDRGPRSRAVIDHIFELQEAGFTVTCLRGNHEQMLLNSLDNEQYLPIFTRYGGFETLKSFGAKDSKDIPAEYLGFFRNLPLYHEIPGYILVHAGLNFVQEDPLDPCQEMIWIRNWYSDISHEWLDGRKILHGHTPIGLDAIRQMAEDLEKMKVLNIDAGCVYAPIPRMGTLCAFDLDSCELVFQANID